MPEKGNREVRGPAGIKCTQKEVATYKVPGSTEEEEQNCCKLKFGGSCNVQKIQKTRKMCPQDVVECL
jgi:hypothetical protein